MPTQPKSKYTSKPTGRRLKIGYITQHAYDGIGMQLMSGVYNAAQDCDVSLIILVGGSTLTNRVVDQAEITAIRLLNSNSIDGLISWASSFRYYININELELFHRRFHPLPIVSIAMPLTDIPSILVDNYMGIEQLMTHLIKDHGQKRFAFIRGNEGHFYSDQRFEAYRGILAKYQLPYDENLVVTTSDFTPKEAIRAIRVFLDERGLIPGRDIETILTTSDIFSAAAIEELKKRGYHIPGELAVVGFNNRQESYTVSPSLTTVEPNFYQHGYQAVKTLVEMMEGISVPERLYIPTSLVVRQSCGCLEEAVVRADSSRAHARPQGSILPKNAFCGEPPHGEPPYGENPRVGGWLEQLAAKRDFIISNFQPCFSDFLPTVELGVLEQLFDSFLEYFQTNSSRFFNLFEEYLHRWRSIGFKLSAWEDYISEFRKLVLPFLTDGEVMRRVEDFFHQARVMVFTVLENSVAVSGKSQITDHNVLAQLGGVFNKTLDVEELMNAIARELPKMGIPGCFLALFENPAQPDDGSRLILAFNEKGRIDLKAHKLVYPSSQLLPPEFFPEDKRFSFLVETCYHKNHQLGLVIFEMGPLIGTLYEILRTSFSSALYGALIMQERFKAEQDRERLLLALEINNRQLEERNIDIKKVNDQLQDAIDVANRANAAKSTFLTNMSHEIRTPLNCILGFAEVAKSIEKPDQQKYYLDLIADESEKLLDLINQLLDISKIEAGKLKIQKEPFDLHQLMESITSTFATNAKNKGLDYHLQMSEDFPGIVKGDALRLRQIIVNLVGNAIKFTHEGGIQVLAEVKSETTTGYLLLFQIQDSGIGIPKERQKEIFDTFVQAESSTTRKYGGTGLGTAIAKQLTGLMGGEIGVISEVGKGSNFWFTVTLDKLQPTDQITPHDSEKPVILPELNRKITILLAEDYPTNQKVVVAHLAGIPCEINLAENGRQAIDKFANEKFDLILMDVQMPEMDGYEATRQIRNLPAGAGIPIIAMTANAFETDIQKCFEVGMNDVITKPFRRELLIEKVIFWAGQEQTVEKSPKASPKAPPLAPPMANSITSRTEAPQRLEPLNFPKILEEFGNDRQLVISVIREFRDQVARQIEKIENAIQAEDYETIWREAHTIKGGALNLAANGLADIAFQLELAGKSNRISTCSSLLNPLRNEFKRLEAMIGIIAC